MLLISCNDERTFLVGDMYRKMEYDGVENDKAWKQIWKFHVPERVRTFSWLLNHDKQLGNHMRSMCGIRATSFNLCEMSVI